MNANIVKLNPPDVILQYGLIILGSEDGLTDISELENIKGEKLEKHVLLGAKHGNTTSNKETIEITKNFYSKIISN